jgi:SPOR domain
MSMADDSNVRTRRSENLHPDSEAGKTSERPPGDPLAELARLIGQDDLFNQMRKDAAQADGRATARHPETDEPGPAPDWLSRARPAAGEFRRSSGEASQDARAYPHGDPLAEAHRQPARAAASADDAQHAAGTEGDEHDPRYADPQGSYPSTAYDQQAAYDQAYAGNDAAAYEPDPYAADAGYDKTYEEPVRERRRGGLITVAAVLGLAVVGTAGAFGYRAFTGSGGGTQPPVIKADSMPAKVAPAPASNDAQGSKLIYDRAEKPQAERVVSREEQPIEMREPRSAGPKLVTTSSISTPGSPGTPSQTAMAYGPGSGASGAAAAEPKKVKTFPIRPDASPGADASGSRSPGTSAPTRGPAGQTGDATRAPTGAPTRTASIPSPGAAGPIVTASTPPASAYVVQLVSNKSEAEAQSAFKTLQSKYPAVLGNRSALIRRVELGDKGTYYRAQVGPFANADQANALCDNLKAAGGQCIVQRN